MIKSLKKNIYGIKKSFIYGILEPYKEQKQAALMENPFIELKQKKKVFMMQTPTHRNIGDHAIALAQKEFIEKNLPFHQLIEVPYKDVYKLVNYALDVMNKDDLVVIHGGGNMGDLYAYEEYMRRFIIKKFKNHKVISMPQTISFSHSIYGKLLLYHSKRIYRKNKHLVLVAREKKSFELMRKHFKNIKIMLTPDIVLSLDKRKNVGRKGIVTCLREDVEVVLTDYEKQRIFEILNQKSLNITRTDTLAKYDISVIDRENEVNNLLSLFSSAEIVVTDRLHGMIFCAITSTPCIVFSNSNHKIIETYHNWLKENKFIYFCEKNELNEIGKIYDTLIDISKENNNEYSIPYEKYEELVNILIS